MLFHLSGRRAFGRFLQREYSEEGLLFWIACQHAATAKGLGRRAQNILLRDIYESFVAAEAPLSINIGSTLRRDIEQRFRDQRMKGEKSQVGQYLLQKAALVALQKAQRQVFKLLKQDNFARFRLTGEYKQLVEEMGFSPVE